MCIWKEKVWKFHVIFLDIDECKKGIDGCEKICENIPGSFQCSCPNGTALNADGKTCDDIDECKQTNICGANANCNNTYGSYDCLCKSGYEKDGDVCKGNFDYFYFIRVDYIASHGNEYLRERELYCTI